MRRLMKQEGGKIHMAIAQRATVCNSRRGIKNLHPISVYNALNGSSSALCEKCFPCGYQSLRRAVDFGFIEDISQ